MANGRNLCEGQGHVEVFVSGRRQGWRHCGFPTDRWDHKAALRFLRKAFDQHGTPEKITIGKSRANTAAIESYTAVHTAGIEIRHVKFLNNIVDQDHRAVKQAVRPMLGFKSFRAAAATLSGIELMHMIRKGQMRTTGELRPARQILFAGGVSRPSGGSELAHQGNLRQNPRMSKPRPANCATYCNGCRREFPSGRRHRECIRSPRSTCSASAPMPGGCRFASG